MAGEDGEAQPAAGPVGVLVLRGMTPVILPGNLRLALHGAESAATLHIIMDMTPHWMRIAVDDLRACERASAELSRLWRSGGAEAMEALESELRAGMQACAAAAFAIDAFYGSVQEASPIDAATKKAWRDNGTARHKQISETFRRRFTISEERFRELATATKKIFDLRDGLVHPKAGPHEVVLHPTICVGVERRVGTYNAAVARKVVEAAVNIVVVMTESPKSGDEKLAEYCAKLLGELRQIDGLRAAGDGLGGANP